MRRWPSALLELVYFMLLAAAYRSVVIATALAGVVLGERVGRGRIAGAAVVAAGIALVVSG